MNHTLRESWLHTALEDHLRDYFTECGLTIPEHVRIGSGWPSRQALTRKKRRIGEAWSNTCSADKSHEIIISLYVFDPAEVLAILVHELIHVTVGVEHGHKKPFTDGMKAVGLEGKPTCTVAGGALLARMPAWIKALGPYPHARLDGRDKGKKDVCRLLLIECPCGLKIRTTQKWLETYETPWPCPCGGELIQEEPKDE